MDLARRLLPCLLVAALLALHPSLALAVSAGLLAVRARPLATPGAHEGGGDVMLVPVLWLALCFSLPLAAWLASRCSYLATNALDLAVVLPVVVYCWKGGGDAPSCRRLADTADGATSRQLQRWCAGGAAAAALSGWSAQPALLLVSGACTVRLIECLSVVRRVRAGRGDSRLKTG